MDHLRKQHLVLILILAVVFSATSAFSGAKLFHDVIIGGDFTRISGTYESNGNNNVDPFVIQTFSSGDECVRLEVIEQGADMEMTLISPTGTIWQNDDGGVGSQPLLKVITNVRGWYPLVVSQFAGSSLIANFNFLYGRFPSSSSQCSNPTLPRAAFSGDAKEAGVNRASTDGLPLNPSE
ncbi:hypothetical protein C2W62_30985 [Candidatus Entotheonella serta]|nr:hypothetical protein C2W62_30985 [Candidatus Entotheonella serta]